MNKIDNYFRIKFPELELNYGLINSDKKNTLTYVCDEKYIDIVNKNKNIIGVITTREFADKLASYCYITTDPVFDFWSLYNLISNKNLNNSRSKSSLSETSEISQFSCIAPYNVEIGKNTVIEPNVTIHSGVKIGDNCIIRSGSVLGFDGFEHKRTSQGILSVKHDGIVIVKDRVEIGSLNSIAKGFSWQDTVIENDCKLDSLVHVAHASVIGERCFITASVEISGSVRIGHDCWIGPGAKIINGVSIGNSTFVGIGAVVTKSFASNLTIAGYPAKILSKL